MTRDFSVEQLAAFLLGVASEGDRQAISDELPRNSELRAQLTLMEQMMPLHWEPPGDASEPEAAELESTLEMQAEETVLPPGASPKYIRPLPENLEAVAALDEQGLGVKEISERTQMTETLVSLKLHHLDKFRS